MNSTLKITDLEKAFDSIASKETDGVPGVHRILGKTAGPCAAISMMTHGNEPSGLAPYWDYLQNPSLYTPERGEVLFILNNMEAGHEYFHNRGTEDAPHSRFKDVNMNRLPEEVAQLLNDTRSEIKRALALQSILERIDAALDIHSTTQESEPMILQIKGDIDSLVTDMPIQKVIENIVPIQIGIPIGSLYGGESKEIPVLEIEAGSHENPQSFQLAIRASLSFLLNIQKHHDQINTASGTADKEREFYRVSGSLMFPNETYELQRPFPMFCQVQKGEILAKGNGNPLTCFQDGHAIFAPKKSKPSNISEEVLFITDPVRRSTVLAR